METHDRSRGFRDQSRYSLLTDLERAADQLHPWTSIVWCLDSLPEDNNEGVYIPPTILYRHLLRQSWAIQIINIDELKYELDTAFQALPEGPKTEHYVNKVRRIMRKLADINLCLSNVEPNVEYAHKQAHYQLAADEAAIRMLSEVSETKAEGIDLRNLDEPRPFSTEPVTPFSFEYQYARTPLSNSARRILNKLRSVEWMLIYCTRVLSDFIKSTLPPIGSTKSKIALDPPAKAEKKIKLIEKESDLDQPARALYWFYLHDSGEMPSFDVQEGGKIQGIQKLVGEKSWKNFQLLYNPLTMKSNRLHISRLKAILPLLVAFPKAYNKASDELKIAAGRIQSKGTK